MRDTREEGEPILCVFYLAPLTNAQKEEIKNCRELKQGVMVVDGMKVSLLSMKYALKEFEGLEDSEGNEYKLAFTDEAKEALTDECVEELMNLQISNVFAMASTNLLHSTYDKLALPGGMEMPGTKVELGVKKK